MPNDWTPTVAAQALLEIFPGFGRLIALRMRASGEEDATLMQIGVLMYMKDQPLTTSDIAKWRRVSLQSASVLVQALVERGWLMRTPDPDDRRRILLAVTPEGLRRAKEVQSQVTEMIAQMLAGLSDEELEAAAVFLPGLRRVVSDQMIPEARASSRTGAVAGGDLGDEGAPGGKDLAEVGFGVADQVRSLLGGYGPVPARPRSTMARTSPGLPPKFL